MVSAGRSCRFQLPVWSGQLACLTRLDPVVFVQAIGIKHVEALAVTAQQDHVNVTIVAGFDAEVQSIFANLQHRFAQFHIQHDAWIALLFNIGQCGQ